MCWLYKGDILNRTKIDGKCSFCKSTGTWPVRLYPDKYAAIIRPKKWAAVFPVKRVVWPAILRRDRSRMVVACPKCWRPKYDNEGKLEVDQ